MPIDGIHAAFQAQTQAAQSAQTAQGAKSVFMGHAVAVETSPASLLADAAEELGFAVDRTKDYELHERKQRESSEIGRRLLELYQIQMQKAGKSEQMDQLVDSLKRLADRKAMQRALVDAFKDPADGSAALQFALDAFDLDPSVTAEQKTELKALIADYNRENAEAIKLGIQGALAGENYPELGGMDATRDLYRQTVGEFSGVQEVFSEIKDKYGARFDEAMNFLFAAISADIESETPSMGRAHLESVHGKLGLVRLTQSVYTLCEQTVERWKSVHKVDTPMTAMGLLERVMTLRSQNFLSAMQIDAVVRAAMPPDLEHEVLFTQDLLAMVRQMPTEFFEDDGKRMTMLSAVQDAVDQAVQREDEWLASME